MDQGWIVTKQRQTIALNPDTDTYAEMIQVTFRTQAGDIASVNIPAAEYTGEVARQRVQDLVDHLNAARGIVPNV